MNGVVLIDKPSGSTSYDIVDRIKKTAGIKKVGHTGTLDPLATGVLPVCLNEATKLVQFLALNHKEYRATLLLGTETDTLDIDGKVIARSEVSVDRGDIETVLNEFLGKSEQRPPRYSAIKYRGRPMYKWARAGFQIEPPLRTIEIYKIKMIEMKLPYFTFEVSCSKGTYIRSLCHDIGERLGHPACLAQLRRTRSGHFVEGQAVAIEGLEPKELNNLLEEKVISMNDALPDLKTIMLGNHLVGRVRQGYRPTLSEIQEETDCFSLGEIVKFTTRDKSLLAIARMLGEAGQDQYGTVAGIELLRVFNN